MLVFHQTGDPTVPVAISEALAAARPDLVTLERFGGDGHVQSWNVDRPRYERAVRAFLERAPAAAACAFAWRSARRSRAVRSSGASGRPKW